VLALLCFSGPARSEDPTPTAQEATAPAEEEPAPEATTPAPPPEIETVTVTAENELVSAAEEATTSAVNFDEDEINALGFTDISDLSDFTPNLEIKTAFAGVNPTLFIRGVGLNDYFSNAQSSVAVYNDGVYMNSPAGQLFQLFDTEAIDVLRGPQGTSYGRNATAGAILVRPRKPIGEFNLSSTTTYGNFATFQQEAAAEVPIVPNLFSARFAGRFNRRDGIVENRCANPQDYDLTNRDEQIARNLCLRDAVDPTDLEENLNNIDNWAARGIFRLTPPVEDMDWFLNVHGGQSKALGTVFQKLGTRLTGPTRVRRPDANQLGGYADPDLEAGSEVWDPTDGDPFAGDYNRTGNDDLDLFGASISGDWSVGDLVLHSVTGYESNSRDAVLDTDASPGILAEVDTHSEAWQIMQSLDAQYHFADLPLLFQTGGITLYENLETHSFFRLGHSTGGQNTVNGREQEKLDQKSISYGIFGQLLWEMTDNLSLEGGARWNWDRKDFDVIGCGREEAFATGALVRQDCDAENPPYAGLHGSNEEAWSAVTGQVVLNYWPTEEISFYAKYVHGWKPGQFNGAAFAPQTFRFFLDADNPLIPDPVSPVNPESIDSFEVGFKTSFYDGRIAVHGAGFVYRYQDLQVFRLRDAPFSPPVNELINANDAQIAGAEAEVWLRPTDQLLLSGAFAFLDSQYNDFTTTISITTGSPVAPVIIQTTQDYSGNPLIASPRFSATGSASYEIDLGSFGYVMPRFDVTYRSDIYFDAAKGRGWFQGYPEGTLGDDDLTLFSARLGYKTEDEFFEIAGWVRNITDEQYKIEGFDLGRQFASLLFVIGEPRTYGLSATIRF
jgi:iron complex outermembrane receptor protein